VKEPPIDDSCDDDDRSIRSIRRAEETIRGFISCPPRQPQLLPDERRWSMVCSALDVVGDTQAAIAAYADILPSEAFGRAYLVTYGLLQTLYLQQDAVRHIFEALDLQFTAPAVLREIRRIRNETVGHPTNISRGQAFAFIVRMSIDERGFDYHLNTADGSFSANHVDLAQLVTKQNAAVLELLIHVCEQLRSEWLAHMEKYRQQKLASLLPNAWHYYISNVWKTLEDDGLSFGLMHVRLLLDAVDKIESSLVERHDETDTLDFSMSRLKHAFSRLEQYFAGAPASFDSADAAVFLDFAADQLKTLEKRLEDLDQEYEDAVAER
jgi:hypothetical protein